MLKSPVTRILAILALTAGPVFAGAVYVPLLPTTVGDVTFSPQVVVGNAANAKRTYSSFFIPENQNGVPRPGDPTLLEIPPGDTVSAAITNNVGLLEINGSADILVYATMPGSTAQGEVLNMALPMITSSVAAEADEVQHILGLARNDVLFSNVYIVSLGKVAATCTVKILDNKGQTLVNATTVTFQPLSLRQFPDALSGATASIPSARAEVTCNQRFYAFAAIHSNPGVPDPIAAIVLPSGTGASSLTIPGGASGTGCVGSNAAHCYFEEGLVFAPVRGDNQKRLKFDVAAGAYSKLHLRMDVLYGGQNSRNPGGLHQIFWLAINAKNIDLLGFTSVKDGNKQLMLRAGIGTTPAAKSKIVKGFSLIKGETYTMDYTYDAAGKDIVWNVLDSSGRLVTSLFDTPNVRNINLGSAGYIACDLSMSGENPAEPPSHGWKYLDVLFEIFD